MLQILISLVDFTVHVWKQLILLLWRDYVIGAPFASAPFSDICGNKAAEYKSKPENKQSHRLDRNAERRETTTEATDEGRHEGERGERI